MKYAFYQHKFYNNRNVHSERLQLILKKIIICLFVPSCLDEIGVENFRWL